MLSLPQYLNCKTFRYLFCFFCKVVFYTHLLYLFVVANKYLLTYFEARAPVCLKDDHRYAAAYSHRVRRSVGGESERTQASHGASGTKWIAEGSSAAFTWPIWQAL